MSNEVFTKHALDPVPLHRNTMPVAECGVHDASVGGKPCKAIDVPILSCASVWLRVQKEAEAWIASGGKLIADPIQRNRTGSPEFYLKKSQLDAGFGFLTCRSP